jgi:hypothetical protein
VFVGPDEHFEVFECPVAMWPVISNDHLSQHQAVTYLWKHISHLTETRFNQRRSGKSDEIQLCLLCSVGCTGEGNLQFSSTFEIFYSGSEVLVAHSKGTVAP